MEMPVLKSSDWNPASGCREAMNACSVVRPCTVQIHWKRCKYSRSSKGETTNSAAQRNQSMHWQSGTWCRDYLHQWRNDRENVGIAHHHDYDGIKDLPLQKQILADKLSYIIFGRRGFDRWIGKPTVTRSVKRLTICIWTAQPYGG
jgi:hypothetical protein